MSRGGSLGAAACLGSFLLLGGCTTLSSGGGPDAEIGLGREVRPQAPPEYDILVAQQHESQGRLSEAMAAYRRALAKDPESAFLHRKLADLLIRQGNPVEALEHAQRAFDLEPGGESNRLFLGHLHRLRRDPSAAEQALLDEPGQPFGDQAAMLLYQIYLDSGQAQKAVAIAEWMIERDPHAAVGYGALARAHENLGEFGSAEQALRDALERDPGNLRIYSQLARMARERGDHEAQEAVFRELLDAHPHHHATLLALADAQVHEDDREGAIATLSEVEQHYPEDLPAVERLGFLYYEAEQFEQAALRFERYLVARPNDGEVEFFLGIVRRRQGNDAAAMDSFSSIAQTDDHYAEARTQLAVLHERAGEFDRALEEVERAVAANPTRPRELYMATLRAKSGDFDGAVAYLEGLLLKYPEDDELLYNLGIVYGEAKRTERAIAYMEEAIEKNPKNASALNYVGYTWAERGLRLDEAEEYITRALVLRPDDGYITDSLGWVYYMRARPLFDTGRQKEAREYIERALDALLRAEELTGGDPVVSEHLGDAYLLIDKREDALERYEEAVELVPREGDQPNLRDKLEALRREFE